MFPNVPLEMVYMCNFLGFERVHKERFPVLMFHLKWCIYVSFLKHETNHLEIKDDIISAIHDSINICDLLIAFMIDDLNVAYDVGYAMAKGKNVLIVSADYSEIPFYLKTVPTILLRDYFDTSCAILNFIDNG
jgi:hypothetical protein